MASCAEPLLDCWQASHGLQSIILIGGAAGGVGFGLITFAAAFWMNYVDRRRVCRMRDKDLTGDRS